MKLFSSIVAANVIGTLIMFPEPSLAQKLETGTAAAIATPAYAKKIASTYCDFL